jgi:hypothetical protein
MRNIACILIASLFACSSGPAEKNMGVLEDIHSFGQKDMEEKYPVSYEKALEIAALHGFKMPGLSVELKANKVVAFWEITKWKGDSSSTINIDAVSGKVSEGAHFGFAKDSVPE